MKHYGKLYAAATAGFMALNALGAAPVFAENNDWDVDIKKTVTKDTGTAVPQTTFEFDKKVPESVTPENNVPVYADATLLSAITITNPDTPITDQTNAAATSVQINGGNIVINPAKFAGKPMGIYRFVIFEKDGGYEDLTYSTASYNVDVFVTATANAATATDTAATGLRVTSGTGATNVKESGMAFENDYTKKTNSNLHNLIVTKTITGNQADMGKQFSFEATITGAENEQFFYKTDNPTDPESGVVKTGDKINVSLGHNETLTVYGLSDGDTYVVNEVNADGTAITSNKTTDGYSVTTDDSGYTKGSGVNATVDVTNDRSGTIPTGILMTAAPYAALVGLGAIFAGFFFRRKRED